MFRDFISRLEIRLGQELPGESAQFSMAPYSRKRISEISMEKYNPRQSAVLIVLFPESDSIHTLLIQRPEYEGVHSGQIGFPGGKFEEADGELRTTALREASEEIGIDPSEIKVIGHLTDLYITPSNFLVSPFVGFAASRPALHPDLREVQRIIEVDLFKLNDPEIKGEKVISHSNGFKIKTPYYEIEGLTVWGATAMMISELNAVVSEVIASSQNPS
ncbi:MAG: NUDIX hydrolase [Bacteroidia bacterium]